MYTTCQLKTILGLFHITKSPEVSRDILHTHTHIAPLYTDKPYFHLLAFNLKKELSSVLLVAYKIFNIQHNCQDILKLWLENSQSPNRTLNNKILGRKAENNVIVCYTRYNMYFHFVYIELKTTYLRSYWSYENRSMLCVILRTF